MINDPNVDEMTKKLGTVEEPISSYVLCVVASKRTRQIIEQKQNQGGGKYELKKDEDKEIVTACKEISEGKVGYTKD